MPLFQRTIKLVLASLLAYALAETLGLLYPTSASIIAILSLMDTRRSTLKLGGQRLFSALLALVIAALITRLLGFDFWWFGLCLALYVPIAYWQGWQIGITPSSVLVSHLFLEQSASPYLLVNELALFLIGTGLAFLANLYMPSQEAKIARYHIQVEAQLKAVFLRFQDMLERRDGRNSAQLIDQLDKTLEEALALVYQDHSNQLFGRTDYQIHYFEMRQRQNNLLRDMANDMNRCSLNAEESQILAQLFAQTAVQLHQTNPATDLLDAIARYLTIFRERPLPQTRQEFETRAGLLQLLRDLEKIIQIKVDFYQHYAEKMVEE